MSPGVMKWRWLLAAAVALVLGVGALVTLDSARAQGGTRTQPAQWKWTLRFSPFNGPLPAVTVPSSRSTLYCAGVRR